MSMQEDKDAGLVSLGRLLQESNKADDLMTRALSPFKLSLSQLLFLKRLEDGEKAVGELAAQTRLSETELDKRAKELSSLGFVKQSKGCCHLTDLGKQVLDSKWDEVERLRRYMADRISPLTLESVAVLLAELNGGYFQGLD